ncbi:MAG: hypothetical protein Q3966_00795 [Neisseria sp.]|nr:hypothetical protein [Neisseria sp.]
MRCFISSLPVWAVLADMVYTFALNVIQSIGLGRKNLPAADGLPVAPEIAFNGLQAAASGGMVLTVGFGLLVLLRLNRRISAGKPMPLGLPSVLGLAAVLAFSLPSLWEWGWALADWARGGMPVSTRQPRYLLVAACQPLVALLCIRLLWVRRGAA